MLAALWFGFYYRPAWYCLDPNNHAYLVALSNGKLTATHS